MIQGQKDNFMWYRVLYWIICGSWLFATLLQGFDMLSINDVYTITGPLEEVDFNVGHRGRDTLHLTVNGQRSEVYCADSRKQTIFESILDQCGVEYDYDPDLAGEDIEASIDSDAVCEIQLVSPFSREELILGLTFDGVKYCDFDTAYASWKEHAMGSAAAFPICAVVFLLGNLFLKKLIQR